MYIIRRIFRWISFAIIFFLVSSVSAVVVLKWLPVYYTPLMFIRVMEQVADGRKPKMEHEWVSIDRISENMPLAVVSSEDARFLKHNGFDFEEIYKARLQALRGGKEWGASTISQQTAKNVFLWPGHSWVRKGFEAYFTVLIEFIWGKERIMEVYLNSVEMGDGIYGVKAVARLNFDKNPDQRSPHSRHAPQPPHTRLQKSVRRTPTPPQPHRPRNEIHQTRPLRHPRKLIMGMAKGTCWVIKGRKREKRG